MKSNVHIRAQSAPTPRLTKSAAMLGGLMIALPTGLLIHALSLLF